MRGLKFRAWNKYQSKYVNPQGYSRLYNNGKAEEAILTPDGGITLEQYTGLDDINGTPIYEGDILGGIYQLYVDWCNEYGGFAMYGKAGYCYYCSGDMHWYEVVGDENIEVIGNIHENKDLLD